MNPHEARTKVNAGTLAVLHGFSINTGKACQVVIEIVRNDVYVGYACNPDVCARCGEPLEKEK